MNMERMTTAKPVVAVVGATGHTGRFVVAELLRREMTPIAVARDPAALAPFPHFEVVRRHATVDDAASFDQALRGVQAVITHPASSSMPRTSWHPSDLSIRHSKSLRLDRPAPIGPAHRRSAERRKDSHVLPADFAVHAGPEESRNLAPQGGGTHRREKFDVDALLTSRLAPDMKDFVYQVQSACDYVKAAAACLSGQTPPKHEDNEQTTGEVRARIQKTVAFVESVKEAQYAGASERNVS